MAIATTKLTTAGVDSYPGLESWLNERGVDWTYQPDFSIYSIDKDASLRNQARVGAPLIDDVVERYTVAMQNGAEFPPIVVYAKGKGRYIVIDGNHRLEAALKSETGLSAYVIKSPSDAQIAVMTYEANVTHGEPTTTVERERQALHLIELGSSHAEAARLLNVKLSRIEYLLSDQEATSRLAELGFSTTDFGITVRRRMQNIRSDVVMQAFATMVKDSGMTFEQVDLMIPRVNAQRSEAQQLSVIAEKQRELGTLTKRTSVGGLLGKKGMRPLVRLNNIVTKIKNFSPDMVPDTIDPIAKEQARVALLDATRRLAAIVEKLS